MSAVKDIKSVVSVCVSVCVHLSVSALLAEHKPKISWTGGMYLDIISDKFEGQGQRPRSPGCKR